MDENNNQPIHPTVLDECESVALDQDLENFLSDVKWRDEAIEDNLFDPTLPDIPVSYTISWNGVPFAPLGGICGLNGQPGNGKSMTFSMLISALLCGDCEGIHSLLEPEHTTVLYIDTEMEMVNTQRAVRRIYNLCGWEQRTQQERLHTICLREVNDAESRWKKILKAIWQFKPTVVFLDGLIDVVKDFNDNKECQDIIYQCMSVATHYNISLWCLLHLNPGSDKAVGHLGSFLERKATDIFVTSKDKLTQEFQVEHKKQRLKKADDIRFKVEDDEHHYGHPVMLSVAADNTTTNDNDVLSDDNVRGAIQSVLSNTERVSMTALRERIRVRYKIGSGKAKEVINRGVVIGFIECVDNKYNIIRTEEYDDQF